MDEGLAKFFGIIAAIGVACFLVYKLAIEAYATLGPWLYIIPLLPLAAFIFWLIDPQPIAIKHDPTAPKEGPMKVNLSIDRRWNGKHRLHIDVKITPKDWAAIKRAGLQQGYILFEHDGVTSVHNYYGVGHLPRIKHVDFDSYLEAESAKNDLITNLQHLRSRIDQQHDIAARPAEQKESYEI